MVNAKNSTIAPKTQMSSNEKEKTAKSFVNTFESAVKMRDDDFNSRNDALGAHTGNQRSQAHSINSQLQPGEISTGGLT